MMAEMVTNMIEDKDLMKNLKETQYDLVLTDPAWGAGVLMAHYLQLPLVYNVRWVTFGEGHQVIAPSPMSYVPMTGSGLTDKMTFTERVKNMLIKLLGQVQDRFLVRPYYQAVCDEYFQPGVDFNELMQGADLWLMRVDFVFEFPRPTMPNVIYMGGFQCKPAKPLPQDLEDFIQSSGEHGAIIMSLGTFVKELPSDITDEIASAFAQLPQKIIWRHIGDRPATLGNNTLLVDWMPQNDLLGHPKMRLFVAHGGTNGVQEAIYHGVPVVGLPLFFDQYDNLLRLQTRGGAKIVTIATVDNDFLKALQEVLQEPSYRENMQRLSNLHRDQPMNPLDLAMFWIEYVMRHKAVFFFTQRVIRDCIEKDTFTTAENSRQQAIDRQGQNPKPNAHLTTSSSCNSVPKDYIQWEHQDTGLVHMQNFTYDESKQALVVPQEGRYFVYVGVNFRMPDKDKVSGEVHFLSLKVLKYSISYENNWPIMEVKDSIPDDRRGERRTMYTGQVVTLEEGDLLMVSIDEDNYELIDCSAETTMYIGAFLL
ncbi:hypothetical protein J4Q44_G00138490 [Coregonus suidteri]|uniref:UDP-glucuronosyltransferase n=1 Tax=Coregonus suidteri TaxID=861788 RepID=A0AAN8QTT1_9TELE